VRAIKNNYVCQETFMQNPFARAARDSVRLTARTVAVALTAFLIASCGGEGFDEAPTPSLYSTTVVFGASLTDTGNCGSTGAGACPPPPYATGRASNGTLFVETIAGRYGAAVAPSSKGGTNFAYGGARTGAIPGLATQSTVPSMVAQLQQFIQSPVAGAALNPQTLFVIDASTFGNNFNAAATAGLLTSPAAVTQLVGAAITDVVTIMTRLYNAGARNMLVINAPNLGLTPLVASQGAAAVAGAQAASGGFAQNLTGAIQANLLPTAPGLNVYLLDLFTLSNTITANPAAAGLTNVTEACVTAMGVCATPDTYLYWDSFHPTRAAGAYIAAQAATLLPSP
jgi:outer membrane lipase/esterase